MKNRRKLKITLISLLILVSVMIAGGTAGFYYLGDYVISALFKSMMVEQLTKQLGVDNLEEAITPEILQSLEGTNEQTGEAAETLNPSKEDSTNEKSSQSGSPQQKRKPTKKEVQAAIDRKVDKVVKAIPNEDKKEMIDLIRGNISKEDMERLIGLAADELTEEDIAEAKRIALKSFTPEQLEEVKTYYREYAGVVLE